MGLDMYLDAEYYIGGHWEHRKVSGKVELVSNGKKISFKGKEVASIVTQIGSWRKANHIHKWFVDNVQEGNDNCGRYSVSREQLEALDNLCVRVLADKNLAQELLPTADGFFFGSTQYDEYYIGDIVDTRELIKKAFNHIKKGADVYYSSSW